MRRLWSSAHASRSRRSKAIPCDPIGMTVTCGRTSRLKRFLSMPRYDGASRRRMNRGAAAPDFPASVQVGAPHGTGCKELSLSSDMRALERAGLPTASRRARPAAIEWQAYLAPPKVSRSRAAWRQASHRSGILGHPVEHITAQPADPSAMKSTSSRKSAEQYHPEEYPSGAAGKARDVVGA